ncbi:MAG: hypothetical protein QNI97_08320 [Desulfobacterales bacterium]|nr:hypothetical protein [Desulfobacterales bacterium]
MGTPPALFRGKRVLVLTPDATRTCPRPQMIYGLSAIHGRVCRQRVFMAALDTHPPVAARLAIN